MSLEEQQDSLLREIFYNAHPGHFFKQIAAHQTLGSFIKADILARRPDAIIRPTGYESLFSAPTYLKIRECKEPWAEEIKSLPDFKVILARPPFIDSGGPRFAESIIFNIEIKSGAFFEGCGFIHNVDRTDPTLYVSWRSGSRSVKAIWARDLIKNISWIRQVQINEEYAPHTKKYYDQLCQIFPNPPTHHEEYKAPPPWPYSGEACVAVNFSELPDYFELIGEFLGAPTRK